MHFLFDQHIGVFTLLKKEFVCYYSTLSSCVALFILSVFAFIDHCAIAYLLFACHLFTATCQPHWSHMYAYFLDDCYCCCSHSSCVLLQVTGLDVVNALEVLVWTKVQVQLHRKILSLTHVAIIRQFSSTSCNEDDQIVHCHAAQFTDHVTNA